MEERLQKILAYAGYGSRRSCEELILAGRVTVNGQVAHLGSKADITKDRVKLDGKLVKPAEEFQYIALYKPRGVLSTVSSPDPRPKVRDLVPIKGSLYPVGRLDVDSEGLMLLTNDGELANQLTHPRYGHEKEYRVLVARHPDEKQLMAWRHGVILEDGFHSSPAQVEVETHSGKGSWLRVIMKEGHKHQIRDSCRQIGLPVVSIIRVRIGSLNLGNLKPNQWRHLTEGEVESLKNPSALKKRYTTKRVMITKSSRRGNKPST
jgi:23S rRNA pseudouridine2605 synthase